MTSAARLLENAGDKALISVSVTKQKEEIDIENQFDKWKATQPTTVYDMSVNPKGDIYWWWTCITSIACSYNLIFITLLAFEDIREGFYTQWIMGNIICDIIFLVDMWIQSRMFFYENGCKISNIAETRQHYFMSCRFFLDFMSILPTDLVLFIQFDISLFRLNRLCKCYRLVEMFDLALGRVKQVTISMARIITICGLVFHWNACVFYILSTKSDVSSWPDVNATFDDDDFWPWPYIPQKITDAFFADCSHFEQNCDYKQILVDEEREQHLIDLWQHWLNRTIRVRFSTFTKEYALSIYWSSLTMTTLGEQPSPNETFQSVFEILDTIIGLVIFAAIMGSVGDLVANANKVKTEWQQLMDGLKQYMTYRELDPELQQRVLKYCEYEMGKQEMMKENEMRDSLPSKLYIQVNKSIQWTTLAKSQLLENCEIPFLKDLASRLQPMDFGPGDVVFSKGELNREMYIVSSGILRSIDANGFPIESFNEGDILGDRSLVWFLHNRFRNRRYRAVISQGYSKVYMLYRDDFLDVLVDYPSLKESLWRKAQELQFHAGELVVGARMCESNEYGDSLLEERLTEMRTKIETIERTINQNYERFKTTASDFKKRLFTLEGLCKNDSFEADD